MGEVTLDQALDVALQLPREQREMLVEILRRREIEARREEIARDARASIEAYRRGELKAEPVEDIIRRLRVDLEANE
jgi:hypothetical protein